MNKIDSTLDAIVATLILFGSSLLAIFTQSPEVGIADISENTWWVLSLGALISFGKAYQTLSSRRLIAKARGAQPEV